MRTKTYPSLLAVIVLTMAACSSAAEPTTTTSPVETTAVAGLPPASYAEFRAQPTACGATAPSEVVEMQFAAPSETGVAEATVVVLNTSCGPIEITVNPSLAPETVNSFVFLAQQGYFDGSASHRIVPGFMMQAGDPTATGFGGPGYDLPDELPGEGFLYDKGIVAMANSGQGTSGSQFFIMFAEANWLPASYSVFGYVTNGFETLDAIEALPVGLKPGGGDSVPSTPLESLYIESVQING
ncbi:MAG: peptidylprolyl isomerase [Actinomycetota bacterium]|nr:peptidylprolyl isomerase [Actinomycetota bacterium]